MTLRQLDLTPALRPSLYDDETLLSVQSSIGLYAGKEKLQAFQDGQVYLTSHRICYVGNSDPRKHALAVDLKDIERTEFYAGFLKSSPKITLWPKPSIQALRSPVPRQASSLAQHASGDSPRRSFSSSPAPAREQQASWICPICGLPNTVPAGFDPATANQYTHLPPCQACGVTPPLLHVVKASIAAKSHRISSGQATTAEMVHSSRPTVDATTPTSSNICPRCTFDNYPSMTECEVCGAALQGGQSASQTTQRPISPGPARQGNITEQDSYEGIKLAFRAGGEKKFLEKLKETLVQRRWLLQSAPPIPAATNSPQSGSQGRNSPATPSTPRIVGIAGLEQRRAQLREKNQAVIGTAFEDLEALMVSAKEVIAMAEQFRNKNIDSLSSEEKSILSDSASALGLVTKKEMFADGSSSAALYITELSRNLAEYLTDDKRGVLRKEGGIMSLVDLWAVFNRSRNGIELVSPSDFEKAARAWDTLNLPIRLRQFKSGLLVVQERSRTDDKTIAALLDWLQYSESAPINEETVFGRSATAQQTAEHFGWSVGVATEELEMAEEAGALVRDQCLDGIRFWDNIFDFFMGPRYEAAIRQYEGNIRQHETELAQDEAEIEVTRGMRTTSIV